MIQLIRCIILMAWTVVSFAQETPPTTNNKARVLRSDKKNEQIPGLSLARTKLVVTLTPQKLQQVTLPVDFKADGRTLVADELLVEPGAIKKGKQRLNFRVTLTNAVTPIYLVATDPMGGMQQEKILISYPDWKEPPPPAPPVAKAPEEPAREVAEVAPPVSEDGCQSFAPHGLTVLPVLGYQKIEVFDKTTENSARYTSDLNWGVQLRYSRKITEKFVPGVYLNLMKASFQPGDKMLDHPTSLMLGFGFDHPFHLDTKHRFHVTPYLGYQREPFARAISLNSISLQPVGIFTLGVRGSVEIFSTQKLSTAFEPYLGTFTPRNADDIEIRSGFVAGGKLRARYRLHELIPNAAIDLGANRFNTSVSTQSRVYALFELGILY